MRVVLALDKFKGTFTANQACELLSEGIRHRNPKIEVLLRPMADGGDGTATILSAALACEARSVPVPDLHGKMTSAHVQWQNARRIALIESAEVLGVGRLSVRPELRPDSLATANSGGLGRLLMRAFDLRPQEIWVGIGGTMTADAGWGLAHALGLRAVDSEGRTVEPALANVDRIERFAPQESPEFFRKTRVVALCDVNAPARGTGVSLESFLPQKGADAAAVATISRQITTLWTHFRNVNPALSALEDAYTGAGGGLVLGLQALFPQLRVELGARKVAQATALGPSLQSADLAVCGEGCLDETTFYGKASAVVTQLAHEHHARVVGVFGKVDAGHGPADANGLEALRGRLGAERIHALFPEGEHHSMPELMKLSRTRLLEIGARIAHDLEASRT